MTGKYFEKGQEERSSVESYDVDLQKDVWKISERLTNMRQSMAGFEEIELEDSDD